MNIFIMYTRCRYYFLVSMTIVIVLATVDINLPQMEYIADHLTHKECRKLIASLHDPGYNLNDQIDLAERKVPEDIPCLNMLLHWNSARGEGRGETHSPLSHRLIQIKRRDLADWLSKSTFHQLANDLDRSLISDPFKQIASEENEGDIFRTPRNASNYSRSLKRQNDDYIWNIMDTIGFILIILIAASTLFILIRVLCLYGFRCTSGNASDGPTDRSKKRKVKKSMVCKTVEYRKDGTREEAEILMSDASEADFNTALKKLNMTQPTRVKYATEPIIVNYETDPGMTVLGMRTPCNPDCDENTDSSR